MRRTICTFFLAMIFIAPYGAGSSCTVDSPCSIPSVMVAGSVGPGETVYLLPGTYKGAFWSLASGTQAQPITFRSVPGTKVVIDGSLRIDGTDTTWRGLEITYTGWTSRTVALPGSAPAGLPQTGLFIYGARTRVEQCSVHDTSEGVGWWKPAIDSTIDGCLIANNGWIGPDRPHGHAIYAQNGVGVKTLRNNVLLSQYDYGLHIYGSSAASLTGFDLDGNVIAHSPALIGGAAPAGRVTVRNNIVWGSLDLGYWGIEHNQDAVVTGNTFAATLMVSGWQSLTITGNSFERMSGQLRIHYPPNHQRYDIDTNTYRCPYGACLSHTLYQTGIDRSFGAWKAETGYDAGSTATYNTPGQDKVVYSGRFVTVLNYHNAASVMVDIPGLTPGASYKLTNAQNTGEALPFVGGAPVAVPMAGWTVAAPYGAAAPLATWDSHFAVFIVEAGI